MSPIFSRRLVVLYLAGLAASLHVAAPAEAANANVTIQQVSQSTSLVPANLSESATLTPTRSTTRIEMNGSFLSDGATALPVEQRLINRILPGRQVWGHFVPHGLPNWDKLTDANYGDLYFMDLFKGDWTMKQRPTAFVPRALQAGLTGMQVQQGYFDKGSAFVEEWFSSADPTWLDNDPNNNFSIAPTMADVTADDLVRMVREYTSVAQGRPSAAKVNGKHVIYIYGSRHRMSAADWANARARLRESGAEVFIIADLVTEVSRYGGRLPTWEIEPYLPYWDAAWLFENDTERLWPEISRMLNKHNVAFAGGIMPGYNRENAGDYGAWTDAEGTRKFRREWELSLAYGGHWQNLVTWNDLQEHTEVQATSTWNLTRADVNSFYAAKLRGLPSPRPTPQLYITTPKYVRVGEALTGEGLVLNGGTKPVQMRIRLYDGAGRLLGPALETRVDSGKAGDAQTSLPIRALPTNGFIRARAQMFDEAGRQIQQVTSAPIVVYSQDAEPTDMLRKTYYSIPARQAMPGRVSLNIQGDPKRLDFTARGTVSARTTQPFRFLEILQNTRLVERQYNQRSATVALPLRNGMLALGGQRIVARPDGFYVGRIIDENERVGYSDPVWIR